MHESSTVKRRVIYISKTYRLIPQGTMINKLHVLGIKNVLQMNL